MSYILAGDGQERRGLGCLGKARQDPANLNFCSMRAASSSRQKRRLVSCMDILYVTEKKYDLIRHEPQCTALPSVCSGLS